MALRLLGIVLADSGETEAARATLERALGLVEEGGGRSYTILHSLGELEARCGDLEQAAEDLRRRSRSRAVRETSCTRPKRYMVWATCTSPRTISTAARDCYTEALGVAFDFKETLTAVFCLHGLAAVAAVQDQAERAGQLWGAADAIDYEYGFTTRRTYERYRAAITDDTRFGAAVKEGRELTLAEAVTYASE